MTVLGGTEDAIRQFFEGLGINLWIAAPILFVAWVGGFWGLKVLIYHRLAAFAEKTVSKLDDVVLYALERPLAFLIIGSGVLIVERILPFSPATDHFLLLAFRIIVVISGALFTDRLLRRLVNVYADEQPVLQSSRNLVRGISRAVVFALAAFAVLDNLGVSITPLLASLGVGSLAVALALRDTLANLFAGIQLVADRTIEVGQSVKLGTGEEGVVMKVGWRATHIRMPNDTLLVVPNSKLTESLITNYDRPLAPMTTVVELQVATPSDLDRVEAVALEVAREVQRTVEGAIPEAEPILRYQRFAESGIGFIVILRVQRYAAQFLVRHEFVKRIHRRFDQEGIVIPYPVRTLHLDPDAREAVGLGGPRRET